MPVVALWRVPAAPELYAWLHHHPIPAGDDLAKALIAYFTGQLGISTTMRAHAGTGIGRSDLTVSTAPMRITVSIHEPVAWTGWLLYLHESAQVGDGMPYVRGSEHTEEGELIASFIPDRLIRPLRQTRPTPASRSSRGCSGSAASTSGRVETTLSRVLWNLR